MKKTCILLFIAIILIQITTSSCSNSSPSGPEPTPTATGLFVERADIIQEQTSHGVGTADGTVILRYGNSTGDYVAGATVTMGGVTLTELLPGVYTNTFANIGDGVSITLSISSLAGNATSNINSPWDCEITAPADGIYQSAASSLGIDWRPYIISGTLPQTRRIKIWRLSDSQVFYNTIATVLYAATTTTISGGTLPNSGIMYIRVYGINEAAIIGANGGSATFSMENSENTRYISMTP